MNQNNYLKSNITGLNSQIHEEQRKIIVIIGHQSSGAKILHKLLAGRQPTSSTFLDSMIHTRLPIFFQNFQICLEANSKKSQIFIDQNIYKIILIFDPRKEQTHQYLIKQGIQILKMTKLKDQKIVNVPILVFINCLNHQSFQQSGYNKLSKELIAKIKQNFNWNQRLINEVNQDISLSKDWNFFSERIIQKVYGLSSIDIIKQQFKKAKDIQDSKSKPIRIQPKEQKTYKGYKNSQNNTKSQIMINNISLSQSSLKAASISPSEEKNQKYIPQKKGCCFFC